jgi:cysteine-rich repeat protein
MRGASRRLTIALLVMASAELARAADTPIATTNLRVVDRTTNASARRIVWHATDAGVIAGAQGSARDPRCAPTGGGAGGVIRFFSDRSAGSVEDTGDILLPCANWKAVGQDPNPKGFVYRDGDGSEGPCKRVTVRNGKGLKATCSGKKSPLDYDLTLGVDEGTVGALLRVGPTDRWCGSADASNGRDGSDGRTFEGRLAPAPASCPVPFVCGDGIPMPGEQCDDGDLDAGDGCDATCQIEDGHACIGEPSVCTLICSDGTLDDGETCDDGNLTTGDGCDASCQTEGNWSCIGEPSVCTNLCGDGFVVGGEECDDGGTTAGDGCSDACAIEDGYACAGAPSVCSAGCGDGVVGGSEECDDANATAADGCSPHCAYEPLCLVTRDFGNPAHASIARITRDGTITPLGGVTLPGSDTAGRQALARCGRRIYFNLSQAIAGIEVGLDGTLTPLPPYTLTEPGQINTIDEIVCSPVQDLVVTFESASLFFGQATSYRVDAGTGALTQAGRVTMGGSSFTRFFSDFHPTTHDLYFASMFDPPLGASPLRAHLGRIVHDAMGNLTLAQEYSTQPGPFTRTSLDGIAFTRDAGELAIFAFSDGTPSCFGQFDAPGTSLPPLSALNKTCTGPVPVHDRWFVPRPEGGPIVYFAAGGTLWTGRFVPPTFEIVSTLTGITEGEMMLGFDGRLIVLLNGVDGTVHTYDVASDLVTVTPNDSSPMDGRPNNGVLLPCPDL